MAKLLFLIIGFKKPSSKKRILDSVEYLKSRGHYPDVREIPSHLPGQLLLLKSLGLYDVVIIQKKLFNSMQLRLIRLFSRKLVYDLDDAVMFHELERNEPFSGKYFKRFVCTAKACDGVIAGNGYLAAFARAVRGADGGSAVSVLPTPVNTNAAELKQRDEGGGEVTIGWIGTKGNLANLAFIEGPLKEIAKKYPKTKLKIISSAAPNIDGVEVEFKQWRAEDEAEDLRSLDIGIMPLEDSAWTRGKGGYKLLQYMAAGVPAVASPVGINSEIIRDGKNGFLASDEGEWLEKLSVLIGDAGLREKIGRAGRETVEAEFSLDKYNEKLCSLLESLV